MKASDLLVSPAFRTVAEEMTEVVRFVAQQGWVPATSSNFSARIPGLEGHYAVSRSGVDKYAFGPGDVMVVDDNGNGVAPAGARPSAETLLHTMLYDDPGIGAVLHMHSVAATVLSMKVASKQITLTGYELLKGLSGVKDHRHKETVPILANSQDMPELAAHVEKIRKIHPGLHGYLIRGHGLYTWGRDLKEARRHVETFDFLFQCILQSSPF